MSRLTNHLTFRGGNSPDSKIYNKLRDLEDIEEELGIELITIFKALDNNTTIYVLDDNNNVVSFDKFISGNRAINRYQLLISDYYDNGYMCLDFGGCGKNWSIDRKELENANR